MKRVEQYPVFWPGDLPFFASERAGWTRTQTEEWSDWLQKAIVPRTDHLLRFFGAAPSPLGRECFAAVVEAAVLLCDADSEAISAERSSTEVTVRGRTVSVESRTLPSGFTLGIGIDLGLLVGRSLFEAHADLLKWEIVWKPKDDASYRNPVLTWGTKMRFDPYHLGLILAYELVDHAIDGASISPATRLARRKLDREEAERLYDNWDQLIRDGV